MTFHLTDKQNDANRLLGSDAGHVMLRGGSRCVAGDTIIDGTGRTIADLAAAGRPVVVQTTAGPRWAEPPFRKGAAALLDVVLDDGRRVRVTPDHRFWTGERWAMASQLRRGSSVAVAHPQGFWRGPPASSSDTPVIGGYVLATVERITETAVENYYTLHVPEVEHYFANGILHHNSGKTFLICRAIATRALKAPGSRHVITRFRFNAVKQSIWHDTFPKMMKLCYPGVPFKENKQDWFWELPGGAQIWLGGLDDKERTEKILGLEFATAFLNECSQISWQARELMRTRVAQTIKTTLPGAPMLKPRMYYDCNPPRVTHWIYRLFISKVSPEPPYTALPDPDNYATMLLNPIDNRENLPPEYLDELQKLSPRQRLRFWEGQFGSANENALWTPEMLERNRVAKAPERLVRIVVAVDPSGTKGEEDERSDQVGIVVAGVGADGHGYVLEDLTCRAPPAVWGRIAVTAYQRHMANAVVGETNFGGAMVSHVIQTAAAEQKVVVPYVEVTASRGKVVRAEPVATLYDQGKVHHVGLFAELEDQLNDFTTGGYMGDRSPDRADAAIWALSELFPGLVRQAQKSQDTAPIAVDDPLHGF